MAGHSHSANIAHRKGAQDAARGKIFQKLSKEIYVAASGAGGADPETNPALKLAISKAKAKNMPKDNIERAIQKAKGDKTSSSYIETLFNATVGGGVTFIVNTLSDNINRVTSNIQAYFKKQNASLGKTGQIPYPFEKKGIIQIDDSLVSEDILLLNALESGADDVKHIVEENIFEVTSAPENFNDLRKSIENDLGITEFKMCEITYIPSLFVELDDEKKEKLLNFANDLQEDDDVQDVYHNIEI